MVASRIAWDPRRIMPMALAAALAVVYLRWQPPSLDLAAAEYRAWLFDHAGVTLWDAGWYGGHHVPGYSVLFPPLAGWLGPRLLGALCVVAASALFERIAWIRFGPDAWLGATWFALGAGAQLLSGRITFLLGLVPALGAVAALQRSEAWTGAADRAGGGEDACAPADRRVCAHPEGHRRRSRWSGPARRHGRGLACALAIVTGLASPVAALFLALAGAALWLGTRRRIGLAVAVAAMAPVALLAVAFPEGGVEPFVFSAFWPVIALPLALAAVLPREQRTLRIGAVLYALLALAAFAIDTPIGGNIVRLGQLCAGPLAALALWPRRRLALACLAPLLLWWQLGPAIRDVTTTSGDPSVHAAYYAPLLAELAKRHATGGAAGRLEIPFTKVHWEARWAAPAIPLARGWERQLDRKVNALFYDDAPLTAARYRAWLDRMAVRWVALPDVPLDYSAQEEAHLIARGLPYLRLTWRGAHWRLYEVADPAPLAVPPARVVSAGTNALTVTAPRAATFRLRIRWTSYWAVTQGDACVTPDGDWTRLRVRTPGSVRIAIRFAPLRIGSHAARCGHGPS